MPTQDPEKIVQYVTKHRAVPVKKPKLNMINWNKVGMHTMQNTRTLWKNNKEQKNIIRKNLNIWDNLEQTKNKQNSCFSDSMVGLNSAVLLLRFLLKIRSIRILDTIVCSGTLLEMPLNSPCKLASSVLLWGPSHNLLCATIINIKSRWQLLLLASHRMTLTGERNNPSWIAREIDIFSIFAWLVTVGPRVVLHINITRGFEFSAAHSDDHDDWLTVMGTFGHNFQKKRISLWNIVSAPQKQGL